MKVILDLICKTLKDANIAPVYIQGAHKGIIDQPTIIVKPDSTMQYMSYTTTVRYFDVVCYGRNMTETVKLMDDVQAVMETLKFTVMPTYMRSIPFYEANVKAWQLSGTYRNFAKNN